MSIDVFEQLFSIHWGHGCFDFVGEGERRSLGLIIFKNNRRGPIAMMIVVMMGNGNCDNTKLIIYWKIIFEFIFFRT